MNGFNGFFFRLIARQFCYQQFEYSYVKKLRVSLGKISLTYNSSLKFNKLFSKKVIPVIPIIPVTV